MITWIKEVGFEVFPKGCDRGAVSYLEGERVPQNWGVVTERIKCLIYELCGRKELEIGGASPCTLYFWKTCRGDLILLVNLVDLG